MVDSGFYVPEEQHDRIAEPPIDPATGELADMPDVTTRPDFISGGSGMVSTAHDYARFLQMLLNGGELDGTRILGSKTVEYMFADHLAPFPEREPRTAAVEGFVGGTSKQSDLPGVGYGGFGLGGAVRTDEVAGQPGSVGEYYWSGGHGTYFWLDPSEDMFVIYLSQDPSDGKAKYRRLVKSMITAAIID